MPFRARFDCLWCGDAWTARGPGDLAGWAHLCPTCLGRAGSNPFLRARLRAALAERAAAESGGAADVSGPTAIGRAFPDDWFLRRGPFERGPVHDTAWAAELDVVTRWLDAQPLGGRILEPAAGVGFFSPLLAARGELHASDADGDALDAARRRLVAHRLLAHLHVADPWLPPAQGELPFDTLAAAFLLGRVRSAGLDRALVGLRARLRGGASLAVIDLRPDPAGGPPPGIPWTYHEPDVLDAALARTGFRDLARSLTGRFFVTLAATAG